MTDKKDENFLGTWTNILTGYHVEARVKNFYGHKPVIIEDGSYGKIVLSEKWTRVNFKKSDDGIYAGDKDFVSCHCLPYASAKALAWSMLANMPEYEYYLEIRIVPENYKITVEHTKSNKETEIIDNDRHNQNT